MGNLSLPFACYLLEAQFSNSVTNSSEKNLAWAAQKSIMSI